MRVTFVLPSDASTGGVRVVYEYADRLIARGHEVTVVVPQVPPYPFRLLREQGPLTVAGKALDASGSGGGTGWGTDATLVRVPILRRPFLDRVPEGDVVVATSWRSAPAVSRLPASAGRPFHLIQHYEAWKLWDDERCWRRAERLADRRDLPVPAAMAAVDPGLRLRGYKRRVDDALSLPTRKLVVTEWLGTALDRVFDQRSTRIPNGIDHGTFYPDLGPEDSADTLRVLAPYRTAAWKGTADAVGAFRRVRRERDDVRFGMFGPSGGESDLPPWVEFHGRVPDSRLRRLYSEADVFVFPSWAEGFGLPPLEAMACGTAVVSTDVGIVRESADGGIVRVPPRDPAALGEALAGLLDDPERRAAVASAGRGVVDRFRWRDSVSALETALANGDSAVDTGDRDSAAGPGRDSATDPDRDGAVESAADAGRGGPTDGSGDTR
ncbi:glycosyltransferase family 4 protein [Salinirubellus sp. GCM10025818]|uniref:glycosyltransferase family 4 protein n=1 Tax=Salinirubellus TaxID=2162630 RepID=UPI0030D1C574